MGKFILRDAFVEVDNVDISDHVSEVMVETQFDDEDVTGMGAAYKEKLKGLGDATITLTVFQDFDASSIDDTLWPLSQSNTPFPVKVRPRNATGGSTNPTYSMDALMFNYSPLDGKVGSASTTKPKFQNASQDGLERSTGAS